MTISNIRGVNINWQVIGDRGPWVMATTGGRRGHDEFIPMAQKIARNGFRVMLHDRRNTGASDLWIEGDKGEEAPWLGEHVRPDAQPGRAAGVLLRLIGRRAHLDPVLSEVSASCARPVAAARYRRRLRGEPAA